MSKSYDYDYEWDKKYCYPESKVLINKLGITQQASLIAAEREITAFKVAKAKDEPIKGQLDFGHLKRIHKYIFCDIYDWAGKERSVNISKGNQFCLCQHIDLYASNLFSKLKNENYLVLTKPELIPERLAYYLSEINVLHPFREGNGRTQRLFIEYLASVAGYQVDFENVSDKEMIVASAEAFATDYEKINALFERITSPISKSEQIKAIKTIMGSRCPLLKPVAQADETPS